MKKTKENNAITLIALVITIVILLILAGIAISALTGSGLFEKAELAKEKSEEAKNKEDLTLAEYESIMNGYINGSRDTITIDKESYEALISKVNSLEARLTQAENKATQSETRLTQVENKTNNQVQVETGTYVGTGKVGSTNKNTLTFTKAPQIVFIMPANGQFNKGDMSVSSYFIRGAILSSPIQFASIEDASWRGTDSGCVLNWSNDGKTLNWYHDSNQPGSQLNYLGAMYKWIAISD